MMRQPAVETGLCVNVRAQQERDICDSWGLQRDHLEEPKDVVVIGCNFFCRVVHCREFLRYLVVGIIGVLLV